MKKRNYLSILLSLLLVLSTSASQKEKDYIQYVKPEIGTAHCRWFHFAPGAYPFGMAKPGPSTNGSQGNKSGWEATGYDYRDKTIDGFPCLHEFQIGGISLMPTTGQIITSSGASQECSIDNYRSTFSHNNESIEPGYYKVKLDRYNIETELTATQRVAVQRFTFPNNNESNILFNIGFRQGESGAIKDAYTKLNSDGTIEGYVETLPEYVKKYQPGASIRIYFYAQTDKKPHSYGTYSNGTLFKEKREIKGKGCGLYLRFKTFDNEPITVKIGLSYTSIENAHNNLNQEAKELTFDETKAISQKKWNSLLGRIDIETQKQSDKIKFYSSLYHVLLGRGLASDVNGNYPKHDGTIGTVALKEGLPIHNIYNTDAIWGTQWNLAQVWALVYPDFYADYISSHLQTYKDSGWLADGIACGKYVSGVGTNLLSVVFAGAYQCGIRNFDTTTAYEACIKNELQYKKRPFGAGKTDTDLFLKYGYVPHQDESDKYAEAFMFSASHTLEYSYSAWALSQWAKSLHKEEDYNKLHYLSKGWERLYDSSTRFIRPKKSNGEFISKFDPSEVWRGFQEGNAYQYTFYVPHHMNQLIGKVGKEEFKNRLDSIFTISEKNLFSGGKEISAFAGLKHLYNHGNQPCLHISWLFNEAGYPSLSQKWVRKILNTFYGTDGIHGYGYGQDEDQGQLGAWYVISSLGLFSITGLCDIAPAFRLGNPLFDKIILQLHPDYCKGKQFIIECSPNKEGYNYAKKYLLNGSSIANELPFETIKAGGTLKVIRSKTATDNYQ